MATNDYHEEYDHATIALRLQSLTAAYCGEPPATPFVMDELLKDVEKGLLMLSHQVYLERCRRNPELRLITQEDIYKSRKRELDEWYASFTR